MKTIEELNTLKNEVETLNKKLAELTEEELAQVSGGTYNGHQDIYYVQRGENLSEIARRFGTTVKILCELNNLDNRDDIVAGYMLFVPHKE